MAGNLEIELAAAKRQIADEKARADRAVSGLRVALAAAKAGVLPDYIRDAVGRAESDHPGESPESVVDALRYAAPHLWPSTSATSVNDSDAPASGAARQTADSGPNPWMSGATWNMTEQARIFRENAARALALATKAGKPVFAGGKVGEMPPVPGMHRPIRGY